MSASFNKRVWGVGDRVWGRAAPVVAFAAALSLTPCAGAQTSRTAQQPPAAQKEAPPPLGPAKNFRLPPHRTFALPNGMHVTFIPFGNVPKVTVQVSVRTGIIDEGPNDVSLSNVVADLLLEGTATRSAQDISRQAAEMGGSVNVTPGSEVSTVDGEALSDFGPAFVKLIADVTLHPKFDDADFKRIIDKHARDNAISLAQADNLVVKQFREMMYGSHPFAHLYPTDAQLRAFTVQRAKDFYAKNYSAKRTTVYVSGVFDEAAVEAAIKESFSGWAGGAPPTENPPTIATKQQVQVVDRPNSVQSAMLIGVAVPDPSNADWINMNVTDAILGGAFGSRITANIREDKGYTYSPYSYILTRKKATMWVESEDVTTNVTGASLTETFKEIDRLRTEAPPAAELDGIKNDLAGLFTIRNSSRYGLIGQLQFTNLHGLDDAYLTSYVKSVLAVTPDQVRETAQKYIDPKKISIAIVGDKKQVEPQLGKVKTILP